jgi:hypothetical protein
MSNGVNLSHYQSKTSFSKMPCQQHFFRIPKESLKNCCQIPFTSETKSALGPFYICASIALIRLRQRIIMAVWIKRLLHALQNTSRKVSCQEGECPFITSFRSLEYVLIPILCCTISLGLALSVDVNFYCSEL